MSSRKLIPVVVPIAALMLLVAALVNVGAQPKPGIRIPPGEIITSPNAQSLPEVARRPVPAAPDLPSSGQGAQAVDFSGNSLDGWQGVTDTKIEWVVQDGRLQQFRPLSEIPTYEPMLFVTRDTSFADGSVEANMNMTKSGGSSSDFRSAFQASRVIWWASSRMYPLRRRWPGG